MRVAEKREGNGIVGEADCLGWGQARLGRVGKENCSGLTPAVAGVTCPMGSQAGLGRVGEADR